MFSYRKRSGDPFKIGIRRMPARTRLDFIDVAQVVTPRTSTAARAVRKIALGAWPVMLDATLSTVRATTAAGAAYQLRIVDVSALAFAPHKHDKATVWLGWFLVFPESVNLTQ